MLSSTLTLILGAGSSYDFGPSRTAPFPLGDNLRDKIASVLNIEVDTFGENATRGSREIHSAYKVASRLSENAEVKTGNLVGAGQAIAQALPGCESIDDFLERHAGNKNFELSAKLGIAHCILDAERTSPLRQDPHRIAIPSIEPFARHWLSRFLYGITKGCGKSDLGKAFKRLKVINFNYDRCFEWFTRIWLRHVYHIPDDEACEILQSLEIVHPYGSIGVLPMSGAHGIPLGYAPNSTELFEISKNILTYSESIEDDDRSAKIKLMTSGCDKYVFLGFAFHPQNMRLLDFHVSPHAVGVSVFASTVKMPIPRWETAQTRIRKCLKQSRSAIQFSVSDQSCEELIEHFGDRWS